MLTPCLAAELTRQQRSRSRGTSQSACVAHAAFLAALAALVVPFAHTRTGPKLRSRLIARSALAAHTCNTVPKPVFKRGTAWLSSPHAVKSWLTTYAAHSGSLRRMRCIPTVLPRHARTCLLLALSGSTLRLSPPLGRFVSNESVHGSRLA